MSEKYGVIYLITNKINGKKYVGQTTQDVNEYIYREYKSGKGGQRIHLSSSIKKYGWENFEWHVIESAIAYNKEILDWLECYYIKLYQTINMKFGYNIREGGSNGKLSKETKKKMSEARKGKQKSEEHKKKISEAHKGKHLSEETKKKCSEVKKGNTYFLGRHHSENTKKKISEAHKGKIISEETRKNISEANKGEKHWNFSKHCSEETKRKTSDSLRKAWAKRREKVI